MSKLVAWNIMTLDGYFEGPSPWDLGMHETIWGDEAEAYSQRQLDDMEALLFGRRTYEGMADYWSKETGAIADAMNSLPKLVASRTLDKVSWNNSRLLGSDLVGELRAVKQAAAKDIYVFGSADLLKTLIEEHLLDDYHLCLAPMTYGQGNTLFKPSGQKVRYDLQRVQQLKGGGVILEYGLSYRD